MDRVGVIPTDRRPPVRMCEHSAYSGEQTISKSRNRSVCRCFYFLIKQCANDFRNRLYAAFFCNEKERRKMATLEELREKLDGIDDQIAKLYEERMKVCEDVGRFKVGAGRKVFDRQREHEKLLDVASKVNGEFNKKGIQELYAQLMSMSRKLQYQQLVEAGKTSVY